VVVMLFDDGNQSSTVHAARIRYYQNQGSMIAEGAVQVITADGRRLETEHLRWDEERRRVYAQGFFSLTTPSEMIRGYGLRADEDLRSYAFARAAGTFEVDE
jgi:LPS export ABC transporter protein LptC